MKIFIVVGMPASGKNVARVYAEARQIPYFGTGDMVRGEVEKRGLAPTPEHIARVSTELRGKDGMGVTRLALAAALQSGRDPVFLEGMRSWPEIELIREKAAGVVVAVIAPRELRLHRVAARGRSDDSPERFDERDEREILCGASVPIARADGYILNTGTMAEATAALDRIVSERIRAQA